LGYLGSKLIGVNPKSSKYGFFVVVVAILIADSHTPNKKQELLPAYNCNGVEWSKDSDPGSGVSKNGDNSSRTAANIA